MCFFLEWGVCGVEWCCEVGGKGKGTLTNVGEVGS